MKQAVLKIFFSVFFVVFPLCGAMDNDLLYLPVVVYAHDSFKHNHEQGALQYQLVKSHLTSAHSINQRLHHKIEYHYQQQFLASSLGKHLVDTKIQRIDQGINHARTVLNQCCKPGYENRAALHDFLQLKIEYQKLNKQLIDIKQSMASILFTANGTPRALSKIDCQRLAAYVQKFEQCVAQSKHTDPEYLINELTANPAEYQLFSDKDLQQTLCTNKTLQHIGQLINACDQKDFQQAVDLLRPYNLGEVFKENVSANNNFERSYYNEQFQQHYNEVGLEKQFSEDPYFHAVNESLMREKYSQQVSDDTWHEKPFAVQLKEKLKNPFATPHTVNKELAWRKDMHNALLRQIPNEKHTPALKHFLYGYISFMQPNDMRSCCQLLAYSCGTEKGQQLYSSLHDQKGTPYLLVVHESVMQNITLSEKIQLPQHAAERECFYNLLALQSAGICPQPLFEKALYAINQVCVRSDKVTTQAYRVMTQSIVHACYAGDIGLAEKYSLFLDIEKWNSRSNQIHKQTLPVAAALMQRVYDPRVEITAQQKQEYVRELKTLYDNYTQAVIEQKVYAQNLFVGYLEKISSLDLKLIDNAGICTTNEQQIKNEDAAAHQTNYAQCQVQYLIEKYVEPFISFDSKSLTAKIFGTEQVEQFKQLCADETIGAKMYAAWQEADAKGQTLVPQYLESVSANEMIDYLDGLQARFARDTESYLLKVTNLHGAASDKVNYAMRCFEKANVIGGIELIKQAISMEQVVAHPLVAAQKLVDGAGTLINFTGKCLITCLPPQMLSTVAQQYRMQCQQEISAVMRALWHMPLYEKYKIAINMVSGHYFTDACVNILSKVKPFLNNTYERLYVALNKNDIFNKIEQAITDKLAKVLGDQVKAIETFEEVRNAHLAHMSTSHNDPPKTIKAPKNATSSTAKKTAEIAPAAAKELENAYHFSKEVIDDAVKFGLKKSKVEHTFGQAKHNLEPLVKQCGGYEETLRGIFEGLSGKVEINGIFEEVPVIVGKYTVHISGCVIDGVVRVGTFFIK